MITPERPQRLLEHADSVRQAYQLDGRDPRTPGGTAWVGSDQHTAQLKAEREVLREAHRREWGREPGW